MLITNFLVKIIRLLCYIPKSNFIVIELPVQYAVLEVRASSTDHKCRRASYLKHENNEHEQNRIKFLCHYVRKNRLPLKGFLLLVHLLYN